MQGNINTDNSVNMANKQIEANQKRSTPSLYWLEYAIRPLFVHDALGNCRATQPGPIGFSKHLDAVLEQGFRPCPDCLD